MVTIGVHFTCTASTLVTATLFLIAKWIALTLQDQHWRPDRPEMLTVQLVGLLHGMKWITQTNQSCHVCFVGN